MELFLNYVESFQKVKKRYLEVQEKNTEWAETNMENLKSITNSSSGEWSEEYKTQIKDVIDDFDLFSERIDKMCTTLDDAEQLILPMINRCGTIHLTLDGIPPMEKHSAQKFDGNANDLMYDSTHYSAIVDNCSEVDSESDLQTGVVTEMEGLMNGLKKVPKSFLDDEYSSMKKGITRQKYIMLFEECLEKYVAEVSDFNTTISAAFADVVGEYNDFPEFFRTTNYKVYTDEHYERLTAAAEADESGLFDEEGLYGGAQQNPAWYKAGWFNLFGWVPGHEEEFFAFVREQPGYENYTDAQIYELLNEMNENGCGYVGNVNVIFASYAGHEEEFEKKYGIPYRDENGDLNYDKLFLLLYTETSGKTYPDQPYAESSYEHSIMHQYEDDPEAFKAKYGCDLFDITYDENGEEQKELSEAARQAIMDEYDKLPEGSKEVETGFNSNTQATEANRLAGFAEEHGDTANIEYLPNGITQIEMDTRTGNGEVIVVSANEFNLYDMNGEPYSGNPVGGHRMTITEVLPDGRYVVSSWGDEYILDPEEADYVDVYSYSLDIGTGE